MTIFYFIRCLLSKGYTRLGRWFFLIKNEDIRYLFMHTFFHIIKYQCYPICSDILKDGSQVTFAFNFFLHGDSNVCANVDVRQHSAVRRITNDDIQAAHNIPGGLEGRLHFLYRVFFKENNLCP